MFKMVKHVNASPFHYSISIIEKLTGASIYISKSIGV